MVKISCNFCNYFLQIFTAGSKFWYLILAEKGMFAFANIVLFFMCMHLHQPCETELNITEPLIGFPLKLLVHVKRLRKKDNLTVSFHLWQIQLGEIGAIYKIRLSLDGQDTTQPQLYLKKVTSFTPCTCTLKIVHFLQILMADDITHILIWGGGKLSMEFP